MIETTQMMVLGNFSNSTSDYYALRAQFTDMTIGLLIFYTIVALTAIVSNILILMAVFKRAVPRNTVNIFLSSLALSDLLMVVLSFFDCLAFVFKTWFFTQLWCKIQSFLLEVSFSASTLTLVAVSVERYLLICHPNKKRRTISNIYVIVALVWFFSLCACAGLLDGYIVYDEHAPVTHERVSHTCENSGWSQEGQLLFYGVYSVVIYLLPLFVMAFAHWRISMSVRQKHYTPTKPTLQEEEKPVKKEVICFTIQEESVSDSSRKYGTVQRSLIQSFNSLKRKATSMEREKARNQKRMKAIRLLLVVTVTFFILWTPFTLLRILALAGVTVNDYLYKFSEVLIFSSTAVNGFIYAFMSLPFRNSFHALITCQRTREVMSRDSGPSYSNSEDNRLYSKRMNYSNGYHSNSDADCKNTVSLSTEYNGRVAV